MKNPNVFQLLLVAVSLSKHTVRNLNREEENNYKLVCNPHPALTAMRTEIAKIAKTDGQPVRFGSTDDFGREVFVLNEQRAQALADKLGLPSIEALAIAGRGQFPTNVEMLATVHKAGDAKRTANAGMVVDGVHTESGVNFDVDFPDFDQDWLLDVAAKFRTESKSKARVRRGGSVPVDVTAGTAVEDNTELIADLIAKRPATEGLTNAEATKQMDAYVATLSGVYPPSVVAAVTKSLMETV